MRTALFHRARHLPESELSAPLCSCAVCGGALSEPVAKLQENPDVHLLHCLTCNAYSGSRMPTQAALAAYYGSYFDSAGDVKVTHDSPERFARHIASFIGETERELTITDFGGGDGMLGYFLAKILCYRGCASVGITVVDYALPRRSGDPRITVRSAGPEARIPFSDVILASAVLEHIPDMFSSLKRVFQALNPGGIMYVRTPAVAGFLKLAKRVGVKLDFTFPAHLHDFGQRFWENVLKIVPEGDAFEILHSSPSLVETDFRTHPWHTLAAHLAKAPWRVLGRRYTLVGGWEIVFRRKKESAARAAD